MRRSLVLSAALHLAVLALVILGLPRWQKPLEIGPAIPVEVVTLSEKPSAPKSEPKPQPVKLEPPKAETPPPAPTPPPVAQPLPEPEPIPEPEPEPAPQEVAALPEPEPEVIPLPEPEPKPEPEPEPEVKKPEPPKPVAKPKPPAPKPKQEAKKPEEKKPQEPQKPNFLKTVEKLKQTPEPAKTEPKPQPEPQPAAAPSSVEDQLARNELSELIRRKVEGCWNVPAGAREAEDLLVEIRVVLNRDGSVYRADIVDTGRMGDSFYRVAAESARRAVQICSPFNELPADRYEIWQTLTLRFNPKEMLGT